MLETVKRYATKVLAVHFLLLVLVAGVVVYGARSVYISARKQAIRQSSERLELIAEQTSRGIENYYLGVMADLDAFLRDDVTAAATTEPRADAVPEAKDDHAKPTPPPNDAPGEGRLAGRFNLRQMGAGRNVPANSAMTGLMWRQLRGRVACLFLVDNENGRVMATFPAAANALAREITTAQLPWFKTLKLASMSHLQKAPASWNVGEYHLIAIPTVAPPPRRIPGAGAGPEGASGRGREGGPAGGPGGGPGEPPMGASIGEGTAGAMGEGVDDNVPTRTVVAVVPINAVKQEFFDPLNEKHVVNAALLDETGMTLVSIDAKLNGKNVLSGMDAASRAKMKTFVTGEKNGSLVMGSNYQMGKEEVPPRIVAFEKMMGLPGRRWTVLASSPLSDAEALVNNVFREALAWAVFVTLSVTALLVSTSFFMIRSRTRFERARHDVLRRELEQARQIQLAWLPDEKNVPAGLEVSAANLPASHISGDFYNWFHLPAAGYSKHTAQPHDGAEYEGTERSKVAIVIGDVTGHGMAAAFLMATTQLLVRTTLSRYQDPGRCLQEVNRQLCTQGFQGQFVTMLVIVLDPETSSIEIATAGHPSPLVERGGKFESLAMEPHLVLGVDATERYTTQGFILEPGASVMLYTDGVVEAVSEKGEQYGVERLMRSLGGASGTGLDPQSRIAGVLEDVKRFCHNRELLDDVTMVAVRTTAARVEMSAQMAVGGEANDA